MTTKTAHRHTNGTPPIGATNGDAEHTTAQTPANELLAWLKERGYVIDIRVKAPVSNDTVSLDNFIPAGWSTIVQVVKEK
jgi:hypothetical protein